ncbi:hypothetical protein DQ04_06281050, partial [Trypanosoma grayi]|uniref:hypothetical protein n=1 Tax=Trypanosoma grayi TaxID=71804 RepID=UPI0004F4642E
MSHIKYMCWRAPLSATPYHACGRAAATGTSASSVPSASLWLATALSAARSTAAAGGGGSCRRWQLPEWPHTSAPTPLVFAVRFQSGVAGACEAPNGGSGDSSKGLQEAEALLRERFGPQAKLVLRRCP